MLKQAFECYLSYNSISETSLPSTLPPQLITSAFFGLFLAVRAVPTSAYVVLPHTANLSMNYPPLSLPEPSPPPESLLSLPPPNCV